MSGGGSPQQVTSTGSNAPWGEQQRFLAKGFGRADQLLEGNAPQYYPGQTVTDTTAATQQGQQGVMGAASANAGLLDRTRSGEFLNAGNPQFQGMIDRIGQAIRPNIDSTFAASGRMGSGSHQQAYASALADQAGRLAYQNYGDERGRQMQAAQDYSPFQAMAGVGSAQEAKQGQYLGDAATRWDFEQNRDQNKLAQYMALVGNRSYGEQRTQTQPYVGNSTMQGIGTAVSALGALGSFARDAKGLLG